MPSAPRVQDAVYSTLGGSGSTYLRNAIVAREIVVHDKPDTVYRRSWVQAGAAAQTSEFSRRAHGYQFREFVNICEIRRYLDYVSRSGATVVLNTWAEQHLLRVSGERRIVFLLREPAAAYRSMCEPIRHGDVANLYGGSNSLFAVFFANRWRNIAEEFLFLRDAGWPVELWVYENMPQVNSGLDLGTTFNSFRPADARLYPSLTQATVSLIRSLTDEVRVRLGVEVWMDL